LVAGGLVWSRGNVSTNNFNVDLLPINPLGFVGEFGGKGRGQGRSR